jgi:SAM-dependent methyltransferase
MPNDDMIKLWSGTSGELWVAEQDRLDRMLAPLVDDLLGAVDLRPGERVLDVGCGTGALSWAAARAVAPGGEVVGIDLSPQMLAAARNREHDGAVGAAVRFDEADAQTVGLAPPFDAWVSRFGVMFFDDPAAAFANLAGALHPGGRVAFTCWQDLLENEWLVVPVSAALAHVPVPPFPAPGQPGPFSLADPDRVRSLLTGAGLSGVEVTPLVRPVYLGSSGADAASYLMRAEMAMTLLAGADEDTLAAVRAAMTDALDARCGGGDVVLDGRSWLVTAHR